MAPTPRFLSLADVAEVLNTSQAQVYALVRRGDLPAIRIGGRNQWRVESDQLEAYIARMYDETRSYVDTHPFAEGPNAAEVPVDRSAAETADRADEASADL
jgi:excisionase family DNA binding protein